MTATVNLLGPFRVEVDGRLVPDEAWSRRDSASLVKLLALAAGHQLHRERVMDALWPDLAPAEAMPRLHKAAHYARKALSRPDGQALWFTTDRNTLIAMRSGKNQYWNVNVSFDDSSTT